MFAESSLLRNRACYTRQRVFNIVDDISIDSLTDEMLRNNASMLTQRVQPCHVPLIETAIKHEMKAALDSIKPEVLAKLNHEAIQHIKSQWRIEHCVGTVEGVVNTPHTSHPLCPCIFEF